MSAASELVTLAEESFIDGESILIANFRFVMLRLSETRRGIPGAWSVLARERCSRWATAAALLSLLVTRPGPTTLAEEVQALTPKVGEWLCREIAAEEVHHYRLDLSAGVYLRAAVYQQKGHCDGEEHVDTIVTVSSPSGQVLQTTDGPAGRTLWELISLVTTESGEHVITVAVAGEAGGGYELEIEELRPAVPGDAQRVVAERLYTEALHRKKLASEEEKRRAIQLFERAAASYALADEVVEQGRCFNQVGMTYRVLSEYERAVHAYGRARELWRVAGRRDLEADVLSNLGVVHRNQGDPERALEHYLSALEIRQDLGNPVVEARILRNVAQARYDLRKTDEALADYRRALDLSQAAGDRSGEAIALNGIGQCLLALGQMPEAREAFEEALAVSRAARRRYLEAVSIAHLGLWSRRQGDLGTALSNYQRALELFETLGRRENVAEVRQNLGTAYVELGQLERSLEEFRRVEQSRRSAGNSRLAAVAGLSSAWVRITLGEAGQAREELRALVAERRGAEDHDTEAEALHALGFAYLAEGRPKLARDALELALARWRATGRRVAEARTTALLGRALHELGDLGAARAFRDALSIGRRIDHPVATALSLRGLAEIEREQGHLEPAREYLEEALAITERQRGRVPTPELRATFLAQKRSLYTLYVDLLIELDRRRPAAGFGAAAFEASERARARALLDLLHERGDDAEEGVEGELEARDRAISRRLSEIQSQLVHLATDDPESVHRRRELEARLDRADEERRRLELEIRRDHPRYAELRYAEPIDSERARELLDPGTALVEYVLGDGGALAFVLTREAARGFQLPTSAPEIEALVGQVRRGLAAEGRRQRGLYRQAASRLYELLIAPLTELLEGEQQLLIVPDRGLHLLPFEALWMADPAATASAEEPRYLVERWAVAYVPSASVLDALSRKPGRLGDGSAHQLVAFADPDYGAAAGRWRQLPGTRLEAAGIAELYPPDRVALFLGTDATEENVKTRDVVATARRLHFATHGSFDEVRPRHSALVLSLDPEAREDGFLRVHEIFRLQLAAELVVLSACETGLGEEVVGEGLIGLTRGFLYAGVPRVVVSLWQVDDEAAAALTTGFYRALESSAGVATALRQAKLALLRDERFSHPSHWASFVLIGHP